MDFFVDNFFFFVFFLINYCHGLCGRVSRGLASDRICATLAFICRLTLPNILSKPK